MTAYYTLMASLPPLPPLFSEKPLPISRIRLERRLRMLTQEDTDELSAMEDVMHWDRFPLETADPDIVERARILVPHIRSGELREIVIGRLQRRTVVAALRRRKLGLPPPEKGELWGYGRWVRPILTNWQEPDFGLGRILPWLPIVRDRLEADDPVGVERALLSLVFGRLSRAAERHYFDYEAVVLYVLRWGVYSRWSGYDSAHALRRFGELVDEGLGEHKSILSMARIAIPGAKVA